MRRKIKTAKMVVAKHLAQARAQEREERKHACNIGRIVLGFVDHCRGDLNDSLLINERGEIIFDHEIPAHRLLFEAFGEMSREYAASAAEQCYTPPDQNDDVIWADRVRKRRRAAPAMRRRSRLSRLVRRVRCG